MCWLAEVDWVIVLCDVENSCDSLQCVLNGKSTCNLVVVVVLYTVVWGLESWNLPSARYGKTDRIENVTKADVNSCTIYKRGLTIRVVWHHDHVQAYSIPLVALQTTLDVHWTVASERLTGVPLEIRRHHKIQNWSSWSVNSECYAEIQHRRNAILRARRYNLRERKTWRIDVLQQRLIVHIFSVAVLIKNRHLERICLLWWIGILNSRYVKCKITSREVLRVKSIVDPKSISRAWHHCLKLASYLITKSTDCSARCCYSNWVVNDKLKRYKYSQLASLLNWWSLRSRWG